jgi:F-type H+-transporting ATPase subunit gamma
MNSAQNLQSVVRTMKALAASSIGQYEKAVGSLDSYDHIVRLALSACLREGTGFASPTDSGHEAAVGAIVFGSDQGLVGQFNDIVVDHALQTLAPLSGVKHIWAVGERVRGRLTDAGHSPVGTFAVPSSIEGVAPLMATLQIASETHRQRLGYQTVYVFHNRPQAGASYSPVTQRLLPLDAKWQTDILSEHWPSNRLPEIIPGSVEALRPLIREYLFISLFRACAESLSSENASRLEAMERADRNIDVLLQTLRDSSHRLRQATIDEELFDVVMGFEALHRPKSSGRSSGHRGHRLS